MKKKILLTLLTLGFLFSAYGSADKRLDQLKESVYNHYLFVEIDEESKTANLVKEGNSLIIETTLDADMAFPLLAVSEDKNDELEMSVLNNNGKALKKMSAPEVKSYAGKDTDTKVTINTENSVVAWYLPEKTDFYKIKVTLKKSASGTTSRLAFILLYENVDMWY